MPSIRILIVDDSLPDAKLTALWLGESELIESTESVDDGDRALALLRDADRLLPHLILLDVNLPRRDGFSVLKELKSDATLAQVPVIMLTGSTVPEDAERARSLHAEMCLVKPADAAGFEAMTKTIERFWRDSHRADQT